MTTLNIDDPFERILSDIVDMNRRKRADYANDGDPWSNFRQSGEQVGVAASDIAEMMIAVKQARLRALRENGRGPANESVRDTKMDRAVYSIIALAISDEEEGPA